MSNDWLLGGAFNQIQVCFFLRLMAQITQTRPACVFWKSINVHMYHNQVEIYKREHRPRRPRHLPKLHINPDIKTLEDVTTWVTPDDFELEGYDPHPPIHYPFTV
jgi:thymidylate synthase